MGSPYGFAAVAAQVSAATMPRQLAVSVADPYFNHPGIGGYPLTISALDLSKADSFRQALDSLAGALAANLGSVKAYVHNARMATQKFDSLDYGSITDEDEYLGLYHFAQRVSQYIPGNDIQHAAQALMDALQGSFVIAEHHKSTTWGQEHTYWDLENAHGVSIFFPLRPGHWTTQAALATSFSGSALKAGGMNSSWTTLACWACRLRLLWIPGCRQRWPCRTRSICRSC
jgi:hypothetical protein